VSFPSPAFQAILQKFAADAESVCSEMRAQARSELAAQLNQAVRRILQSPTREALGDTAADAASAFASNVVWLLVQKDSVRSEKLDFTIPLSQAAALNEAAHSLDPVVALPTPAEVSGRLAHFPESRALIYPVVAGKKAVALLYAVGETQSPALELFAQVASTVWQALEPPPPPSVALVAIAPAAKKTPVWEALGPEEQQIHLRAQRYARVQVAEMRLRNAAAVQSGRARRNIYGSLRDGIDAARDAYRKEFFSRCPSMVDYLHLELTRTLANDDPDLLGKDYPGPMV
jgi:hypothetical protein